MMLMHLARVQRFPISETAVLVSGLSVLGAALIELLRAGSPVDLR